MYLFILPLVAWFHLRLDTFLSIIAFLCWSIWHTFPERGLLHEKVTAFNWIAVKEMFVIMVVKVGCIGQRIGTHSARFPRVNAHHVGHFIQHFQYSLGWSDVADGCHRRVPEKLVVASSTQVVLDTPLRYSIFLLSRKRWPVIYFIIEVIKILDIHRLAG